MDSTDVEDMKSEFYDFLANDWELKITYRVMNDLTTVKNARFGFVTSETFTDELLFSTMITNPQDKVKAKFGVSGDTTLIVVLATKELETKHIVLSREKGAFVLDGQEYEILKFEGKSALLGTSIVTVVSCKERKPLRG